jgi:hypothetical protein
MPAGVGYPGRMDKPTGPTGILSSSRKPVKSPGKKPSMRKGGSLSSPARPAMGRRY